eukprot:COSAG03_NODE_1968_length_3280_cov_21.156869_1_plen_79_part_00
MPHSFTAAGYAGHQEVDATLRRSDLGLPGRGFVMCSFNRLEKLDEPTFGLWLQVSVSLSLCPSLSVSLSLCPSLSVSL